MNNLTTSLRRNILLVVLSALILCGPFTLQAQKQWSLKDCIEYALANNIQIKQQKLNLQMENDNLLQSKAAMLPSVNGNLSHSYNYGRTIDRFTNTFATREVQSDNFYASGQLVLFNGFQLLNTVARNQLNVKAGMFDVEKMQNDVSLNIAAAYLNILFNQEYVTVASDQLDITRLQVDRISKLVEAGSLPKNSLLNIEAQASNEELQLVTAQNNLDLAHLTLIQLLDFRAKEEFSILKPDFTIPQQIPFLENPDQVFTLAQGTQPQVRSAEIKVQSSEKDLKIARGGASPTLTMSGSYGTGYSGASERIKSISPVLDTIGALASNPAEMVVAPGYNAVYEKIPFRNQINDNVNKTIGFYLSIPIFNGLQTRTAISRAKIGIENSRLNLELTKNQLFQDIQRAYADAMAAIKKYLASKKSVDAMKEAFFYTEQRFNVGMANSVDYNEAKKNLSKAEADLLNAKYEYVFKRTVLDFYMGRPLDLK
ncbi:MAG: TolC family protein [Bacteroidetes bacterium]|nr:TolC family protein [Bacteroidota bacterium]